jgi:hypothetical protein
MASPPRRSGALPASARAGRRSRGSGALPAGSQCALELRTVEPLACLAEAQILIEDWRVDYDKHRPHSAFGMMAPALLARTWGEAHEALQVGR